MTDAEFEAKKKEVIIRNTFVSYGERIVREKDKVFNEFEALCKEFFTEKGREGEEKRMDNIYKDYCLWTQEDDWSDLSMWNTSCGEGYMINDGTPRENKMNYCCFCGKKLHYRSYTK
jgi:hypothetical protein